MIWPLTISSYGEVGTLRLLIYFIISIYNSPASPAPKTPSKEAILSSWAELESLFQNTDREPFTELPSLSPALIPAGNHPWSKWILVQPPRAQITRHSLLFCCQLLRSAEAEVSICPHFTKSRRNHSKRLESLESGQSTGSGVEPAGGRRMVLAQVFAALVSVNCLGVAAPAWRQSPACARWGS